MDRGDGGIGGQGQQGGDRMAFPGVTDGEKGKQEVKCWKLSH